MRNVFIYPYNLASQSCHNLKGTLGAKIIRRVASKFRGSKDKVVINWGCSGVPDEVLKCKIINHPVNVQVASNKLRFFRWMKENNVPTPAFTEDKVEALSWIANGKKVCARTVLNGHDAEGLVITNNPDELPDAKLYTVYVPKAAEYRVHVMLGEVIDFQRKVLKGGIAHDAVNWNIRNLANGFIFQRGGVDLPEDVKRVAIQAVGACNLEFGGVDVIWNEKHQKAYVLEVNTAPGIEGSTVQSYARKFKEACSALLNM